MSHRGDATTQSVFYISPQRRWDAAPLRLCGEDKALALGRAQFRENQTDIAPDNAELVIDAVESLAD